MLTCRDLVATASDYIDGELRGSQKLAVRMHLLMCRHCRKFVRNLASSTELIRHHSSSKPDEEFLSRIEERVNEALDKQPPRSDDP